MPIGTAPTRQQLRSWRGHPLAAASIRMVAFATPIVAALVWSAALSRLIPSPRSMTGRVAWLIGMLATSTGVLFVTERLARRILPLAALLKLSLVFPDHVPSRFSIALRTGTTKQLARRLQQTKLEPTTRAGATELLALVAALNHHDPLTRGHSERVRALSDLLAAQLKLEGEDREKVRWAALLHDIGKLRVPGEILRKPGKPTADEWKLLKTHPAEGLDLIRGPIADWLGEWARAIGEHHEQFDGSGYPSGLSGTEISYAGRLVAVADVFDVITAARSYKKPMTIQEARLEITRCAGTQFDPEMVRAFLQISIGDLRKAMGPFSWIAQLALFGRLATAPAASGLAGTLIAATGLVGPVTSVYSEPDRVHPSVVYHDVSEAPSSTGSAAPGAAPQPPSRAEPEGPGAATDDGPTTGTTVPSDESATVADQSGVPVTTLPGGADPDGTGSTSDAPATTTAPSGAGPASSGGPAATVPATSGPAASLPATSVPAASVPATSPPLISVPPITIPVISLPPISVPPITIPITIPIVTVTVPPITLPVITVPPISLPPITLPVITLPPITLPKIHL